MARRRVPWKGRAVKSVAAIHSAWEGLLGRLHDGALLAIIRRVSGKRGNVEIELEVDAVAWETFGAKEEEPLIVRDGAPCEPRYWHIGARVLGGRIALAAIPPYSTYLLHVTRAP